MRILFVFLASLTSMFLAIDSIFANPSAAGSKAEVPEAKDLVNYDTVRSVLNPENTLPIITPGREVRGKNFCVFVVLNEKTVSAIKNKDLKGIAELIIIGVNPVADVMRQSIATAELSDETIATVEALYNNRREDSITQVLEKYKLKEEFPDKFKNETVGEKKNEKTAALIPFMYNNGATKFCYPPELETATRETIEIKSKVEDIDRQLVELNKTEEEELKDIKPTLDKLDKLSAKKKELETEIPKEQAKRVDESESAKANESLAKLEEELKTINMEIEKLSNDDLKYKLKRREELRKKKEALVDALLEIKRGLVSQ